MNLEQFLEKYGDIEVVFSGYYKFMFTFKSLKEDDGITVYCGGDSDEIYRFWVDAKPIAIRNIDCSIYRCEIKGVLIDIEEAK